MTELERLMLMLDVIHEENKAILDTVVNIAFKPEQANNIIEKARKDWDRVWNLAAFGEYDEENKLVVKED